MADVKIHYVAVFAFKTKFLVLPLALFNYNEITKIIDY